MNEVTAVRYSSLRDLARAMQIIVGLIGIRVENHRGYEHRVSWSGVVQGRSDHSKCR